MTARDELLDQLVARLGDMADPGGHSDPDESCPVWIEVVEVFEWAENELLRIKSGIVT